MIVDIVEGNFHKDFLHDPETHKEVSLFIFERPIYYLQWNCYSFYENLQEYKNFAGDDTSDPKNSMFSTRVKRQAGKMIYYDRDHNRAGSHNLSVASLSTHISKITLPVESWQTRYENQMEIVKTRWNLEDPIKNDEYGTAPFVVVGLLEGLYREEQLHTLDKVFEGCNVHFILYDDPTYSAAIDVDYPILNNKGKVVYREESNTFYEAKAAFEIHLKGRFLLPFKRQIQQATDEDTIDASRSSCMAAVDEEIDIWNTYGDTEHILSQSFIERLIETIDDKMQEWVYVHKKVLSGEWPKSRLWNWKKARAAIRREALREKLERLRKQFQDYDEVPAFESDEYRVDSKGGAVGLRGFCRRIRDKQLEGYTPEEREELYQSRMHMRKRRHNSRDSFKAYHKSYNRLKFEVTCTWEKRKRYLTREQLRRWNKIRKQIKSMDANAARKAKQDVKQRHIEAKLSRITIDELKSVDNKDIVKYYLEHFNWVGRDNSYEYKYNLPF